MAREDESRDRRLERGEEEAIRRILDGVKPEGRQRALELPWQGALECLLRGRRRAAGLVGSRG